MPSGIRKDENAAPRTANPVDARDPSEDSELIAPSAVVSTSATIPTHVWAPMLFVMAVLLCVSAALDIVSVIPAGSASSSRWRFSMIGAGTPKLLKVTVAAMLVMLGLAFSGRRILSYVVGVILLVAAVAVISVVPLFMLDALQVRAVLPSNLTGRVFALNVGLILGLLVAISLVILLCGLMLLRIGRWLGMRPNSPDEVLARVWER